MAKKKNGIAKGAPSGLVVSLLFHAVVFFIAGLFVVFRVMNPPEPEFEAPPSIERPRMKLKKPRVKVQKSSQPKPSSRIVAKVKTREMPEIQLPDLMGTGEGLLGGIGLGGEFMDLPEIGEMTLFGSEDSIGNDLVGTFYDLKRTSGGSTTAMATDTSQDPVCSVLRQFIERGWDRSVLDKYRHSSIKLYTSTIIIPETPSVVGPMAFGEDMKTGGWGWAVLYEGTLVSHRDIRFRFWGMGDNFLAVAVDGKTVNAHWLDGLDSDYGEQAYFGEYVNWRAQPTPMTYAYGHEGQWIDLKAGEPHRLQVIIAETGGGASSYMLCVEEDGVEYPGSGYRGGTTYPIFQTAVQSRAQVEELERVIYPGDASVNVGPIFQDFEPVGNMITNLAEVEQQEAEQAEAAPAEQEEVNKLRTWRLADGTAFEAELLNQTSESAWFKMKDDREVKLPVNQFSAEDRLYLKLNDVPTFRIDFTEKIDVLPPPISPNGRVSNYSAAKVIDYSFKTRAKIMDTTQYTYPLKVEYFAVGRELEGKNNYILWQRSSREFIPSKENDFSIEFESQAPIRRIHKTMKQGSSRMRGEKYDTYLVTVTDQRGEIIAYRTPNKFLFEHLDRLKKLPVTRHFNDECIRVAPSRPIDNDRLWADSVFRRSIY